MTEEELKKELERIQKENDALKGSAATLDRIKGSLNETTSSFNLNAQSFTKYTQSIFVGVSGLQGAIDNMVKNMSIQDAMGFLDTEATSIQNAFGVSKERINDFKQAIADAAPELVQFGLSQEDAAKMITELGSALGTTGVVGQEALKEIGAASQVTGQGFGELATAFRDVGVSIYDVGDRMKEVTDYAKSVGVSVQAVSKGVVGNLDKMNMYNFEGGINGLTKMAAQAARLGVSMDTVFNFAEKIFNPEGAIEMAASLQRLGVASSDLLDPLRAMDLAANDPKELQNELVELTKTFTKFNEKTQQFEIMPGEKRRLREIAQEMNIPIGELTKMSIKAAEFDEKLKKIQFPSFAADEETKELIAGMAQMKEGKAVIEVKDPETGERILKEINQLTPEDLDKLKESEQESSKTIEQLAIDQLDQLKLLNSQVAAAAGKTVLGLASANEVLRVSQAGAAITRSLAVEANKKFGTEDVRGKVSSIAAPLERGGIEAIMTGDINKFTDQLKIVGENLIKLEEDVKVGVQDVASEAFKNTMDEVLRIYKEPIKQIEKKEIDFNLNTTIKSEGNVNMKPEDLFKIMEDFFKTQIGVNTVKTAVNSGQLPE